MTDEYAESGECLAMNMVGHLAPADRAALWRRIADRLAPGAPLVLNTQPPARAEAVPENHDVIVVRPSPAAPSLCHSQCRKRNGRLAT